MTKTHLVLSYDIADKFIDIFGIDDLATISCYWRIKKDIGNDLTIFPIIKQYYEPFEDSIDCLVVAASSQDFISANKASFFGRDRINRRNLQIVEILIESEYIDIGFTPKIVKQRRKLLKPWHILPINDLREHDENDNCWCNPTVQDQNIIHNSADGREYLDSLKLLVGDIPNHLALVAKHWFPYSDTDDLNVATALKWLEKRYKYLMPTMGVTDAEIAALVSYFDSFLSNLIDRGNK